MSTTPLPSAPASERASTPEALATEAAVLAAYLLPEADVVLSVPRIAQRVARDYGAAMEHHGLTSLRDVLGRTGPVRVATLLAWDGLFAPDPARTLVRQRLLLMTAILESQPELAAYFLPRDMSRLAVVWTLAGASLGSALSALLSLGLRVRLEASGGR